MPAFSLAKRWWILGDCPPDLNEFAPAGYGPGCVIVVHGPTSEGDPPQEWYEWLLDNIGLNDAARDTLCVVFAGAFNWTAYWDPTGQATPPSVRCGWPDPPIE